MTTKKTQTTSGGSLLLGLLTIAFIVLRLLGVITWSWWWVLAPTWIPIAFALLALAAAGIITLAIRRTR